MKIVTIIGARPQFIKAAPLSRALSEIGHIQEVVVHTGQHYDKNMSEVFFDELQLTIPDYNLGVGSGFPGQQTGKMLVEVEKVLIVETPDCVVVFGDTNSTVAGALAAVKLSIPVAHIEAGLRSFRPFMPEEINRVVTDHISSFLFTPTSIAKQNLLREGIPEVRIIESGDIMLDVAEFYRRKVARRNELLARLELENDDFGLVTLHRAENTNDIERLRWLDKHLIKLSRNLKLVLPIHPRTYQALKVNNLCGLLASKVKVIEPVGYLDMVELILACKIVITDSGGLQKEAFFFRKPCVTLRDETEWQELLILGVNQLFNPFTDDLNNVVEQLLNKKLDFLAKPYGNGNAGAKIAKFLSSITH